MSDLALTRPAAVGRALIAAAAMLIALAAGAQSAAACTITMPMAGLTTVGPENANGAIWRNVSTTFRASGTPTKASATCHTQPSGKGIRKFEFDWDGNGTADETVNVNNNTTIMMSRPHTYTQLKQGQKIQARVTDDLGNTSAWFFVLENIVNKPPTANFTWSPSSPHAGQTVTLNGGSSFDQPGDPTPHISSYQWEINGSQSTWSSSSTKTFTVPNRSSYTVRLRVRDKESAFSDWTTKVIQVVNAPPTISSVSVSDLNPLSKERVNFSAVATDPDGSGNWPLFHWNFGDGSTSTSRTPSHTYATPGTRTVVLTVRDADGATAVATRTVTVRNRLPVAAFACTPPTPFAGETVVCTSSATDSDGSISSQWWDLDGNGTADAYGPTISIPSTTPTDRLVRLRVTDNSGGSAFSDQTVTFHERRLTAAFEWTPATVVAGSPVTLDASASRDPGGPITSYRWDLDGDGVYERDTGGTPTVTHTFLFPGDHAVGVRVANAAGGSAVLGRTVAVQPGAGPPIAPVPPGLGAGGGSEDADSTSPPGSDGEADGKQGGGGSRSEGDAAAWGDVPLPLSQKRAAVLRRGLALKVTCSGGCSISGVLKVDRKTARRLGLGRKATRVARVRVKVPASGSRKARVRLGKKAKRALRRARGPVRIRLRGTLTAPGRPSRPVAAVVVVRP